MWAVCSLKTEGALAAFFLWSSPSPDVSGYATLRTVRSRQNICTALREITAPLQKLQRPAAVPPVSAMSDRDALPIVNYGSALQQVI